MKQRKSTLLLIVLCCLCFVLMTGCQLFGGDDDVQNPSDDTPVQYNITIDQNIKNGSIECDIATAKAGDTITVTAKADESYQLVSITVNGEAIEGNSFVMPAKDVVLSATFALSADLVKEVPAGALKINAQSAGGAKATGHITIVFGENGLTFEAFVGDSSIVERDGVAVLFSQELPVISGLLKDGKTIKVAVNAKGVASVYATDADGVLQAAELSGVTTDFDTWSRNGEKLDGYHVEIFVPYSVFGTTAESAKGSITVCPMVYSAYGNLPATGAGLPGVVEEAQNTFAVLTDDNTVRDNKYIELSAQLGSLDYLEAGQYWDLSKDYYADDIENYPNREALLVGHDNSDNNLMFYRVSGNEMYVKATLTLTEVHNPNDQYPKFGLMLFDGATQKGVFFYVDAVMQNAGGNTLDNIIGTSLGCNVATNGWGAWSEVKKSAFDLATKSIVMEMVYQDGWVHMYANGEFVKSTYYGAYNENLHFGIKSFGLGVKVTDYFVSADAEADGWADKKIAPPEQQDIDILFAGDSYMEYWNWSGISNALSYTGATYVNAGIGGTKVGEWIAKAQDMSLLYNPAKIAFHIGVNDIDDAGAHPDAVIASLEQMFELYHAEFPDATIYWNSLVPNTMFASKYEDYKVINAAVADYASDKEWLVYIDQTTSFDLNGAAREDVFGDGLHFNIDVGYPIWANNMLTAMGYERIDGTVMGDIDRFSHTGLWQFNEDGSAYSEGNIDTSLWFKDIYGENVYVEVIISIGELRNSDGYPKYGLLVRNESEARWGFIDCFGYPAQNNTSAGLVSRVPEGLSAGDWNWNGVVWGGATGCDHGNVKLAIAKLGDTVYFLVNDVIYATGTLAGDVVVGYESFNLETTISNVKTSTDVTEIERKLGLTCQDAIIDGEADDTIWTEEVLANTIKFGDKGDGRYFTVAAVKGTDGVYFLVNTYTFDNARTADEWWGNANIEFRFGNNLNTQQFIYVDGVGFNAVKSSGGISLSAIKACGNEGDIYHNVFEFFAPYNSFEGYDANSDEIAISVWGWVWDNEGWNNIMNIGGYPALSVSAKGLRFERSIRVVGENAGVDVEVQSTARAGDTVVATVNVADGQALDYIKIGETVLEVVDGKVSFVMPNSDATIEVALKGIGVSSNIVNNSGENYISANVNCDVATATVGQTISFTVDGYDADEVKVAVSVNGKAVSFADGVYSYVVEANDTAIAIEVAIDYNLAEAIDGVMGEGYGTPMTIKAEGGRYFIVWAKSDAHGVYFYVEAASATLVADAADFWGNNNFEFRLNGAEHGGVNTKGEIYRASKGYYSYAQQENGLYKHIAEVYVNEGWIPEFNADSVVLNYAFKTPGETVWHENMINNQWNRTDWWRTGHSTPHGGEHIGLGVQNGLPSCIHVTGNGIVHDCERASVDGDLSEYEGLKAFTGMGNDNAKFDFVGYVAEDGVYIGITIYQNTLGETRGEWWDNDNFEIKLLGDRAGFSIIEDFIAGCAPISDYALVRADGGDSGFAYKTVIELFYAYDFSTAQQATFQVGVNGNGFGGWQALMWDGNVPYITSEGIDWISLFVDWSTAQLHVAEKMAEGEGLTLDGKADEDLYDGLTSVTYENVNGATVVIEGRKLSTGVVLLASITHTRPVTDVIQGDGGLWWNHLGLEFRMGGNYSTQMAVSTIDNGAWDQYCAGKNITVQNADGTYTTTFEVFLAFTTEYGGMDYDGDVQICIGGPIESGFTWITGLETSNLYANENGFVRR